MTNMHEMRKRLSGATQTALENEAGKDGGILTGFVGLATFLDDDGETRYAVLGHEHGTYTNLLGMIDMLSMDIRNEINHQLDERYKD